MEDQPAIIEQAQPTRMQKSPFMTIWLKPRETIREIVIYNPELHVLIFAFLAGIGRALSRSSGRSVGDNGSLITILPLSVVFGGLGGILLLYIMGAIYRWLGAKFGGTASSQAIRASIAWSKVPQICGSVLWIPLIILFGNDLFTSSTVIFSKSSELVLLYFLIIAVMFSFWVWTTILKIITLAEVHQFLIWKSIAIIVIPIAVVLVPILCLVVVMVPFA